MLGPLVRTILFVATVPATVVGWVPWAIARASGVTAWPLIRLIDVPAIVLALAGAAIALPSMWDFAIVGRGTPAPINPPKVLVVRGAYRWMRNPMYVGIVAILVAEATFFRSMALLGYAGLVLLGFDRFVRWYEEPTLRRLFPEAYADYCRRVPRWLGRVST